MKPLLIKITVLFIVGICTGMSATQESEIELVCVRKHNASNICHYNFKVEGAKYRYLDVGCKSKKEDVLEDAKAGKLGLAKDWKIDCPEKKDPK